MLRSLALGRRIAKSPISSVSVPYVIESTAKGERVFDIFSRLLKERIVMLHGPVTDSMATVIVASLLFLEAESPAKPINMYINSPGGSVTAGLVRQLIQAIYDTVWLFNLDAGVFE